MKSMSSRDSPNKVAGRTGCLARLGRLGEAPAGVKVALAFDPDFTVKRYRTQAESTIPCISRSASGSPKAANGGRARGGQENKLIGIASALAME